MLCWYMHARGGPAAIVAHSAVCCLVELIFLFETIQDVAFMYIFRLEQRRRRNLCVRTNKQTHREQHFYLHPRA